MRVLVLSGGGCRGAFEAGVIKALVDRGYRWDAIAGISVGAINGAWMAMFPKDQQPQAADELAKFWMSIKGNKSVYKRWFPFGYLHSLWKGGLYNTSPIEKLVKDNLDLTRLATSGVPLRVGAVCLEDGSYHYADSSDPDIHEWVLASAAFPVAFPPRKIRGSSWSDGGVRNVTPVIDALDWMPDQVDVIEASPWQSPGAMPPKDTPNTILVALRTVSLMSAEIADTDLDRVPEVEMHKLNMWSPPHGTEMPFGLDFDPKGIAEMYALGLKVGAEMPWKP